MPGKDVVEPIQHIKTTEGYQCACGGKTFWLEKSADGEVLVVCQSCTCAAGLEVFMEDC